MKLDLFTNDDNHGVSHNHIEFFGCRDGINTLVIHFNEYHMKLAVLGSAGVPGRYGGFETLAENLVRCAETRFTSDDVLTVYCSAKMYPERIAHYLGARLRYSRLNANGAQSVLYDVTTAIDAALRGHDRLLLLGVSGAIIIPFLRLFSRARIVTNVDGIEWRRGKWKGFSRRFLRWSEAIAVRYSHEVIADNQGIVEYLEHTYGVQAAVIAYGGDHVHSAEGTPAQLELDLPSDYALALCRIEPENNVSMILEAFDKASWPLVFVGNWNNSEYGRKLHARFFNRPNVHLLDPIYEPSKLYQLRQKAAAYVHGHSAGGTNPSLVEMMHFGLPVLAYDCSFNRYTTENQAAYFSTSNELRYFAENMAILSNGTTMKSIANRLYCWNNIATQYFDILFKDDNFAAT